jgi:hypothetical protein
MRGSLVHAVFVGLIAMLLPWSAFSQTGASQDESVSLGDLARSLRQKKAPAPAAPAAPVIDNDNLTEVIDQAAKDRQKGKSLFSADGGGKTFKVSSPDGTCSLSFDASATALVSTPFVVEDLPETELAKLDGPATFSHNTLELSIYNATAWNVKEITVSFTIVRHNAKDGEAKLIPAEAVDDARAAASAQKLSDTAALYHLKASAAPQATTVFRSTIDADLDSGQDWHWAIVQARGIPPSSAPAGRP